MNILFVCRGNTCRSAMACALARHLNREHTFRSAGTEASDGGHASGGAIMAMRHMKIDLEPHTSERLRQEHVEWADKIYTMTPERRCQITQLFPEASPKVELLDPRLPIEDPIGGGWKQYQILIERIEESLKQKLASLGSL